MEILHLKNNLQKMVSSGLTLVELIIAMAIVATLASIAIPAYKDYVEKTKVAQAITDIRIMSQKINAYWQDARSYPDSLAQIGFVNKLDPWNRSYMYLNLAKNGNGGARRDRNLVPLNSDFDLYSLGKDNETRLPISQKVSQDDVLRANDGKFLDLAKKY